MKFIFFIMLFLFLSFDLSADDLNFAGADGGMTGDQVDEVAQSNLDDTVSGRRLFKADSNPRYFLVSGYLEVFLLRVQVLVVSIITSYFAPIFLVPIAIFYLFLFVWYILKNFFSGRLEGKQLLISLVLMALVANFYGGNNSFQPNNIIQNIRSDMQNLVVGNFDNVIGSASGVAGFFWLYNILANFSDAFLDITNKSNIESFKNEVARLEQEKQITSLNALVNVIDPKINRKLSSSPVDQVFFFVHTLIDSSSCAINFGVPKIISFECPLNDENPFTSWIFGSFILLLVLICYFIYALYYSYIGAQLVFMSVVGFLAMIFLPFEWGRPAFFDWIKKVLYFVIVKIFLAFGIYLLFFLMTLAIEDYFTVFENANESGFSVSSMTMVLGVVVSTVVLLLSAKLASFVYSLVGMGEPPKNAVGSAIMGLGAAAMSGYGALMQSFPEAQQSGDVVYGEALSNSSSPSGYGWMDSPKDSDNVIQSNWSYVEQESLPYNNNLQLGWDGGGGSIGFNGDDLNGPSGPNGFGGPNGSDVPVNNSGGPFDSPSGALSNQSSVSRVITLSNNFGDSQGTLVSASEGSVVGDSKESVKDASNSRSTPVVLENKDRLVNNLSQREVITVNAENNSSATKKTLDVETYQAGQENISEELESLVVANQNNSARNVLKDKKNNRASGGINESYDDFDGL